MSAIAIRNTTLLRTEETKDDSAAKRVETEISETLAELKRNLDTLYNQFDFITDPALIDSCIYDLKATHAKYNYFLKNYKELCSRNLA